MEIIDKKIFDILVCPNCRSKILFKKSFFFCAGCKEKFYSRENIFSFLPKNFKKEKDFAFKKAQVDFFDEWSDRGRVNEKFEKGSFDSFFICDEPKSIINYSETEMKTIITKLPKNSIVVELGCGAGEHTAFITGARRDIYFIAVDISPKSVLETRERIKADKKIKCKVYYMVADAEALPFQEKTIDGVIAVMFFHHVLSPRKSIKEIKRILSDKGMGLIVDIVSNNPLNTMPRKLFPYLPDIIKRKLKDDYLLESGEMPLVSLHSITELKKITLETGMKILNEKRYNLFVFFVFSVTKIFPVIKKIVTRSILEKLYTFENNLLKKKIFNNFAGAVALCISQ